MRYLNGLFAQPTGSQRRPLSGRTDMTPNAAGGFVFALSDWGRLDRFLILGSEGGTYYASERTLTVANAQAVVRCLAADGVRTVARIVELSRSGRAPKPDPALFALALAASVGTEPTKRAAFEALPLVARTGTHLYHFVGYIDGMRGWGRGLRRAVGRWFTDRPAAEVAYQALKYQRRDGWSGRDLLRLAHPTPPTESHRQLFGWMTSGWPSVGEAPHPDPALRAIWAFERAKRSTDATEIARLIRDHRLPREAVPTEFLTEPTVWEALLETMPLTALLRNLATLTRLGLLAPGSPWTATVADRLTDGEALRRARLHPIAVLGALRTYAAGQSVRGEHTWTPTARIVDALDAAFYEAFALVKPTGKRWLLALDVSASMTWGSIAGMPGLTPRVASAAMALVTAATEAESVIVGFSAGPTGLSPLALSPRQRLDDAVRTIERMPMGGTDCSLPMRWAAERRLPVDVFVVYTDNETWAGAVHPLEALRTYRQQMGRDAKLIVVGMTATGFTIADPTDGGMLDVVGFDAAAPALMADFAAA